MRTVVLATGNAGKVGEFAELLPARDWHLKSLKDIGFSSEIAETGSSFRANALIKAQAIASATPWAVLSDDSGLEVEALGGAPGVHTARYAGEGASSADNRAKLLRELHALGALDPDQRRARFVCVLCWLEPGKEPLFFEGHCAGHIAREESGQGGFGYDSLFCPEGTRSTFASLPADIKHKLSHRGKALEALLRGVVKA